MTMRDGDPAFLGTADLARAYAAGETTPRAVVEALLARIDALDPGLNAFVAVDREGALAAAEAATASPSDHPLNGVPVVVKDVMDIAGTMTGLGSAAPVGRMAQDDATVVARMRAAGMVILGKVQTVEFAMGGWGGNERLGTPRNPFDLATPRIPGGSSSGCGVALAAGLAPLGVGTDIGGSLRLPASFCGLTSLKVTVGRISNHGIVPLIPSLDSAGPMARSAEDAALLYDVLRGPDPADAQTWSLPSPDPTRRREGVRGLRLARIPESEREGVAADMLAAYDEALTVLSGIGAEIVDVELPFRFAELFTADAIVKAESYASCGAFAEDTALPLDSVVRRRLLAGRTVDISAYLAAKDRVRGWKVAYAQAMAGVDALLTPTTETAAPTLAAVDLTAPASRFTRFANLLDLAALALPDGFTAGGLPLSLQVVAPGGAEEMALRVGIAFQTATDWHRRHPTGLGPA